jgi:arylsulfatase A-like enzyme
VYRILVILVLFVLEACSRPTAPPSVRLVDLFDVATVEGAAADEPEIPRTEWRFDLSVPSAGPDQGWKAGPGVTGLGVQEGRLTGRTTTATPIVHIKRTTGFQEFDLLHAVEIRMRASAGANLAVIFRHGGELDINEARESLQLFPWGKTPIVAGEEVLTYTLTGPFPAASPDIEYIVLQPTDAAGASFEIESIRLIFRREYLAGFPTGVAWQGAHEIYRETLVARAPESIHMDLDLPERPWLEMALATVELSPVTFRVALGDEGGEAVLLERTVTTPNRWEKASIDLTPYAGRDVALSLSLSSEKDGVIGFWGSPVVRNRGAMPGPESSEAPVEPPQGVILIMVDTLRSDHLDAYGYQRPTAPNLSALAAGGARFADGVAQATWTKVSTPSILTALYPTSHGVLEFTDRLPASAVTMAEVFRQAGYATLSFSSVLFTGKFTNLHQGFEELHESASVSDDIGAKTARTYTDRLLPWLDEHREVPFFVFFHLFDPHDPYEPARPYNTLWFDPSAKSEHETHIERVRESIQDPLMKRFGMPNEAELLEAGIDPEVYIQRQIAWYDGSIRAFDVELGRLMERLAELGLREKTLVVFVSDHGEEFLEHGRSFHGQSVYGELTRVPLMFSWPGTIPAEQVVEDTVQTIDIMPTVLELSRLPLPDGMQGQSLVPVLLTEQNGRVRKRPAISERAATRPGGGSPPPFGEESLAIVSDGWKLIHNTKGRGERPEFELYDQKKDPLDQTNLAEESAEVVERLSKQLDAWHREAMAARLEADDQVTESMSPQELERLRSLGYIQ